VVLIDFEGYGWASIDLRTYAVAVVAEEVNEMQRYAEVDGIYAYSVGFANSRCVLLLTALVGNEHLCAEAEMFIAAIDEAYACGRCEFELLIVCIT
jgi:hypothetical protein